MLRRNVTELCLMELTRKRFSWYCVKNTITRGFMNQMLGIFRYQSQFLFTAIDTRLASAIQYH